MGSPLYKVDPLPKFFLVICISVLAFMIWNIPFQVGLLVLVLIMARLGNISGRALWNYIKGFAYLVVVMVVAQSLFWPFPKTFLFQLPSWFPIWGGQPIISLEGLNFGVYVALRFIIIVTMATVFSLTTNSRDFLLSLLRIKVPFEVSFMVNVAVRFVPMITDEAGEVMLAQKARGLELEKGGIVKKLRALLPMLLPLLLTYLLRAREMAIAMEARAFRYKKERTTMRVLKMKRKDWAIFVATLVATVSIIVLFFFVLQLPYRS